MDEFRNKTEKKIKFPAAVIFAIIVMLFQLVRGLMFWRYLRPYNLDIMPYLFQGQVITILCSALLIVGLFVRKSRVMLIIPLTLKCLLELMNTLAYVFSGSFYLGSLNQLATAAAYLLLFASVGLALLFAIVSFKRETSGATAFGKLWFVSGIFSVFYMIGSIATRNEAAFIQALFAEVPMMFLLSWWLTHPYKKPAAQYYTPVQNVYAPNRVYQAAPVKVYCTSCGKEFLPGEQFCASCGQKRSELAPQQIVYPQYTYEQDVPSGGMNALAFFIPIVGLILYLVWKDQTPTKAKSVGKFGLIGFIVWMSLSILLTILSVLIPLLLLLT